MDDLRLAAAVRDQLTAAGLRVEVDDRQEKIGYKIREAQLQKVPYMLVVGDRESAERVVAVRGRAVGDLGALRVDEFVKFSLSESDSKGARTVKALMAKESQAETAGVSPKVSSL